MNLVLFIFPVHQKIATISTKSGKTKKQITANIFTSPKNLIL